MVALEVTYRRTWISKNGESYKKAEELRNRLTNENIKFEEFNNDNVMYFNWT